MIQINLINLSGGVFVSRDGKRNGHTHIFRGGEVSGTVKNIEKVKRGLEPCRRLPRTGSGTETHVSFF